MNGLLGSYNLSSGIAQSIFVCDTVGGSVVTLNVCNRGTTSTFVDVAIGTTLNIPESSEWIEYNVEILPKCALERTAIAVGYGQYITVRSSASNVSAACWGVTIGDTDISTITPVALNVDTTTPTWSTSASLSDIPAGNYTTVQLSALDSSALTYSVTSGSLPTGMALNSTTGLISGVPSASGYTPSGVLSTFTISASDTVNSASRVFNITKKWYDGSSSALAAKNALSITRATGAVTNGLYWLNLGSYLGTQQVYCILDPSISGGGWMVLYGTPSGATNYGVRFAADRTDISVTPISGNYSIGYNLRSGVRSVCESKQTLVYRDIGAWMRLETCVWDTTAMNPGQYLFETTTTMTSATGVVDTNVRVGLANYSNTLGGDFGIGADYLDHHSSGYYNLNGGCNLMYLYQYASGYKVNTALSGWSPVTNTCAYSDTNDLGFLVAMK